MINKALNFGLSRVAIKPLGLLALVSITMGLTGCADDKRAYPVKIIDGANILDSAAWHRLSELKGFPLDIPVVVETVDSLGSYFHGDTALKRMRSLPYWAEVRPKGWFDRNLNFDRPEGTGVYVLASRNPDLLQIRFGERIRLMAYRSGLVFGPTYRSIQDEYRTSTDKSAALTEVVVNLNDSASSNLDAPWYLRYFSTIGTVVFVKSLEWTKFSGSFYQEYIVRPIVALFISIHALDKPWLMIAISALLLMGINLLFGLVPVPQGRAAKISSSLLITLTRNAVMVVGTFIFYHIMQALIGGRIEDEMYLRELGIEGITFPSKESWTYLSSGIWIALAGGVIFAINSVASSYLSISKIGRTLGLGSDAEPDENQIFDHLLDNLLAWTTLLLFLPRGLSVLVIAFQIIKLVKTGVSIARSEKTRAEREEKEKEAAAILAKRAAVEQEKEQEREQERKKKYEASVRSQFKTEAEYLAWREKNPARGN